MPCCADLSTARDSLTSELQQAATKQAETDTLLADSKAQGEQLAKELQELQQAAASAAEEAAAVKEQLEQELAQLREAQVC